MATSISWREPIIVNLPSGGANGIRKQCKHVLALPKVTRKIGTTGKQSSFPLSIAELALKSFAFMRVIFVSLQVSGACALMRADVARKHLSLQVEICKMLVPNVGGSESFRTGRTFVWTVSTMTPSVTLNAGGILVWSWAQNAKTTSKPTTEDFTIDIVGSL
jgi:hypothetical protein